MLKEHYLSERDFDRLVFVKDSRGPIPALWELE
jgi:hypothetical protein